MKVMLLLVSICLQGEDHPVTIVHDALDPTVQGTPLAYHPLVPIDQVGSAHPAGICSCSFLKWASQSNTNTKIHECLLNLHTILNQRVFPMEIRDKEHRYDRQKSFLVDANTCFGPG